MAATAASGKCRTIGGPEVTYGPKASDELDPGGKLSRRDKARGLGRFMILAKVSVRCPGMKREAGNAASMSGTCEVR